MTRATSFVNGEARYLDDMREGLMLAIRLDEQGDVYVSVRAEGTKIGPSIRLCASGGADNVPGLLPAMRAAHAAIKAATDHVEAPAAVVTLSREQGIERCARAGNKAAGETMELLTVHDTLDVLAALQGRAPRFVWHPKGWAKFAAAACAERQLLVDSGLCPDLADIKGN